VQTSTRTGREEHEKDRKGERKKERIGREA